MVIGLYSERVDNDSRIMWEFVADELLCSPSWHMLGKYCGLGVHVACLIFLYLEHCSTTLYHNKIK